MEALLFIVLIVFIVIVVRNNKSAPPVVVSADSFSQNGVTVNFSAGQISFNGKTGPVSLVTGVRMETTQPKGERWLKNSTVMIELDDLQYPIHKVKFTGGNSDNHAKEFMQRLSIALRKAGGPSFV
ncbi:hypothetical protein [Spirosoma sordidisoli]|uniref:Uncharacterized protein n=1 Tax=Spirosoma sordidisoli TaxID=2502893 RepID=A0A4Q2UQK3_9BACT|nr:hypothetical protein [Spirosoma sordidisoli]RYC70081.1 hypothetical protein EQG79_09425 [Spirosoma sordidisoli]